jgi:uncharacterized protein YjbJ (UPF0337 family)
MNGTADKVSGKTKQALGKATNNKELQLKGKAQQTKGTVKQQTKQAGKAVSKKVDHLTQRIG